MIFGLYWTNMPYHDNELQLVRFCNGASEDLPKDGMFSGFPCSPLPVRKTTNPQDFSDRYPHISSALNRIEQGAEAIVDTLGVKTTAALAISGVALVVLRSRK